MAKLQTSNHRTRIGAERSERTRQRILDAAMRVFAEKGPDAPVINDFIIAAGLSRGTFYNYFKSTDELLMATSKQLEDDLIISIEGEINAMKSPAERMAFGMLLWLEKADMDPTWCAFINRVAHHSQMVERQVTGDLQDGIASGEFNCPDVTAAYDNVVGTVRQAMYRMLSEKLPAGYKRQVVQIVLQGLGVKIGDIQSILKKALPAMQRPSTTLR